MNENSIFTEIFIGATIVLLAFGTGSSIVVVNLYYKGQGHDHRPPRWVRVLVFKCLAPMVCMTAIVKEATAHKVRNAHAFPLGLGLTKCDRSLIQWPEI